MAPKAGLPTVKVNAGKPADHHDPQGAKAPTKTVAQPLIKGKGAAVKAGQTVHGELRRPDLDATADLRLLADTPSSPTSRLPDRRRAGIHGFDKGLVGQTDRQPRPARHPAGRGLRQAGQPPGQIKGTDTLVFVVDILDAY